MSTSKEDLTRDLLKKLHKTAQAAETKTAEVAERASKLEIEPEAVEAGEGEVLYSELFEQMPPSGSDFPVRVYADDEWHPDSLQFIPPLDEELERFVVDHSVLEPELRALRNGLKVLIKGDTGCGKTTLQKYIAHKVNQPYLRINGRRDMESDVLLGRPWVSGGEMHYEMGELPKAMQEGWFVSFDEPWKTPSGILMALQRMFERGGILQLDDMPGDLGDKQVVADERFVMALCDNVIGVGDGAMKYGATMIQDGSTLNRIDVVLHMDYLPEEAERDMVSNMHPWMNATMVEGMVALGRLLRVGFNQDELSSAFSPRNLYSWGVMARELGNFKLAFEHTVVQRYEGDSEATAVWEHYRNVFGE